MTNDITISELHDRFEGFSRKLIKKIYEAKVDPNENLNIDYHTVQLTVKALNKVTGHFRQEKASKLLGVTKRTVFRYCAVFKIKRINGEWKQVSTN